MDKDYAYLLRKINKVEQESGGTPDWSEITSKPDSSVEDIDSAVDNSHIQNTDTILDEGGSNEISAERIDNAFDITQIDLIESYSSSFKLLMQFENNVADDSPDDLSCTNNSVAFTGTSKYGSYAASFANGHYINVPSSFHGLGSNFHIEFWAYYLSGGPTYGVVMSTRGSGGAGWQVSRTNNQIRLWADTTDNDTNYGYVTLDTSAWTHVAYSCINGVLYTFKNGELITTESGVSLVDAVEQLQIGRSPQFTTETFVGYLDQLVIMNQGLYSDDFTPHEINLTNVQSYIAEVTDDGAFRRSGISKADVDNAVAATHEQNTDTILDEDGSNEISAEALVKSNIQFIIDGGGSEITTGVKGFLEVPFDCTIEEVRLLADQSGSIQVDIWKDTYSNFPPTDTDSITASAVPAISSAVKSEDTSLTGWTTSVSEGDILGFNVDSVTDIERVTIIIKVKRT